MASLRPTPCPTASSPASLGSLTMPPSETLRPGQRAASIGAWSVQGSSRGARAGVSPRGHQRSVALAADGVADLQGRAPGAGRVPIAPVLESDQRRHRQGPRHRHGPQHRPPQHPGQLRQVDCQRESPAHEFTRRHPLSHRRASPFAARHAASAFSGHPRDLHTKAASGTACVGPHRPIRRAFVQPGGPRRSERVNYLVARSCHSSCGA